MARLIEFMKKHVFPFTNAKRGLLHKNKGSWAFLLCWNNFPDPNVIDISYVFMYQALIYSQGPLNYNNTSLDFEMASGEALTQNITKNQM